MSLWNWIVDLREIIEHSEEEEVVYIHLSHDILLNIIGFFLKKL